MNPSNDGYRVPLVVLPDCEICTEPAVATGPLDGRETVADMRLCEPCADGLAGQMPPALFVQGVAR